jgi:cephalosporin hydroxylase
MKLSEIHQKYDTDKGTYHSYIDKYDEIFGPYKYEQLNFLEIGCLTCGSLKMFNEYFSRAHIYGVDNWAQNTDHIGHLLSNKGIDLKAIVEEINDSYPRVHLKTCDSTNTDQVKQRLKDVRFKFILDDGDHSLAAQLTTFKNFLPYLEYNGVYIIEDVAHVNELAEQIAQHLKEIHRSMSVEILGWYKGNRADDAILIIK